MKKIRLSLELLIVLVLLVGAVVLRFQNLGYSNYTADEYGAMIWTKHTSSNFPEDLKEFFLTRKKGPLQYSVSYVPIFLTQDYNNELALRIPFALFSAAAVLVFYALITKLTNDKLAGFIGAALLMTNGFVAAFGRIAQYQNLNLFFSLAALYFYADLVPTEDAINSAQGKQEKKRKLLKKSLLGTLLFSLSFYAHWDAIYVVPPAAFLLLNFLFNKEFKPKFKIQLLTLNLLTGAVLILPFLIPYASMFSEVAKNQDYLNRRFGFYRQSNVDDYIYDFNFYNPLLAYWAYVVLGFFGALVSVVARKKYIFVVWFAANFLFFEFFIRTPGTHIYNFLLPLIALIAIALSQLVKASFYFLRHGTFLGVIVLLTFLYLQAYLIFVDHQREYPWEQEKILGYKTQSYDYKTKTRYLIGFPHNRYWEEINEYINAQNRQNGEEYTYITNESTTISDYYMDAVYSQSGGFYAVGVKRPWSFVEDYKFPQVSGKRTVKKFENEYGETVVTIYRVDNL